MKSILFITAPVIFLLSMNQVKTYAADRDVDCYYFFDWTSHECLMECGNNRYSNGHFQQGTICSADIAKCIINYESDDIEMLLAARLFPSKCWPCSGGWGSPILYCCYDDDGNKQKCGPWRIQAPECRGDSCKEGW